jgi:small conductance mechanosensitive channel
MPNGNVANSDVDNRTMNDIRRIDLHFKVSLEEDIEEIRAIILAAMKIHPEVLKDPEPDVWMDSIDDYAMNFYARSWCVSVDYYPMSWHQLENIKKALDKHGIKIQIPKQEFTEVNPVQKPKDN